MSNSKMSSQNLRMAIVNLALEDEGFREALTNNAQSAVEERFGKQDLSLQIHFEKEGELPILIPTRTDRLAEALDQVVNELGDRPPTRGEFEAIVIRKAWNDEVFLNSLITNAGKAIRETLGSYSANLPEDVTVTVYHEKDGECAIVVPLAIDMSELSEEQLESVAGGEAALITGAIVGGIAGAIAGKVVDVVWEAAAPETPDELTSN